jgi:hypothetical protein
MAGIGAQRHHRCHTVKCAEVLVVAFWTQTLTRLLLLAALAFLAVSCLNAARLPRALVHSPDGAD